MMKQVGSVVRLVAGLSVMGACASLFGLMCLVVLPSRSLRIRVTNVFGKIAGRACLWVAGASVPSVAAQTARHKPAIYISNHTSILDIFIGIWLSPIGTCGIGKKEVIYYPFFGQLYWLSGHLRVDRSNARKAIRALGEVSRFVKANNLGIWIWPEGTRSRDGRLQPLKKGFAHLALATRLPIVPVVVTGAHKGWEKDRLMLRPVNVDIKVLDPIDTTGWQLRSLDKHVAEVHRVMNEALPPEQQTLSTVAEEAPLPAFAPSAAAAA